MLKGIKEKLQVVSNIINIQNVKTNMTIIFNAYNEKYGGTHVVYPVLLASNTIPPSGSSWEVIMNLPSFGFGTSSSSSSSRSELENYYETNFAGFLVNEQGGSHDFNKFDLLAFWKAQSRTFPVLSRMARDILTSLVSTVASE